MKTQSEKTETIPNVPYLARAFTPAHADLARSACAPARLANEAYVEALARIVYYWGYPAVDLLGRTGMWEMMKSGPGLMFGILPGAPMNTSSALSDYLPPSQRFVVTPNNDTFYGIGFANLGQEPAVIQTPRPMHRRGTTGRSRSSMPSATSFIKSVRRPKPRVANSCWSAPTGRARSRTAS